MKRNKALQVTGILILTTDTPEGLKQGLIRLAEQLKDPPARPPIALVPKKPAA